MAKDNILEVAYSEADGVCRQPVVELRLYGRDGKSATFGGIIDSGADITTVPLKYIKALMPLPLERHLSLRAYDGRMEKGWTYKVALVLCQEGRDWFRCVPERGVLCADREYAMLGKDVLNHFRVILDGQTCILEKR